MRHECPACSVSCIHACCSNSQNYIPEWEESMDAVTVGGTARTLPSALIGKRHTLFCNIEQLLQFTQK